MKMKKAFIGLAVAALAFSACSKTATSGLNDASKRYFDAWMKVNHPDLVPTELGSYVLSETEGTGNLVGSYKDNTYLYVNYTSTDLDGDITATTSEKVSKQLGSYVEGDYYGPTVWSRVGDGLSAGIDELVSTMRVGGIKKAIVPGWLFTNDRYDTPEDYLNNVSGSDGIYEIEIVDAFNDVVQWEIDSIGCYLSNNYPKISLADSLKYGFYYSQTKAPTSEEEFATDTTIYINYIGRLLNGTVFDTNIKDTAKFYGLYDPDNTYGPTQINWISTDEDYSDLTMTSDESSMIDGFAYCIFNMKAYEKGTCIFYSALGYSTSGSGNSIPSYSPLRFDIEIVDKE